MKMLIPEIEIGKHYLWIIKPIELTCEYCGYIYHSMADGEQVMVFIQGKTSPDERIYCSNCGVSTTLKYEGWYDVMDSDGILWTAPYTQLFPIG